MADEALERGSYSLLKDLRVEIEGKEETFSLCFWLYLLNSTTLPVTIIQKVHQTNFFFFSFIYLVCSLFFGCFNEYPFLLFVCLMDFVRVCILNLWN